MHSKVGQRPAHLPHPVLLSAIAYDWRGIKTIPQNPRIPSHPWLWNFWIRHWYFFSPYYSSVKEIKNRDRVWVSDHKIVVISTSIIATENYVTICYIYRHILYQLISVSPGEFFSIIGNYKSRNETTLVLKHIIYFWL